jgi:cytosine/adenosine deaminase-related metal-dependent hydrolase
MSITWRRSVGCKDSVVLMLCEDTPQAIFPNRRIGRLRKGHEASFPVLDGNSLADLKQRKNIRLRFKQGHLIDLGEKK